MRSPGITTRGPEGESYPDFQRRVAEDQKRVNAKCEALDQFIPRCTACGETCDQIDSGTTCKTNGMRMISRWAQERASREWYRLGNFGGSWHSQEINLAALLDRVHAEASQTASSGRAKGDCD